MQMHSRGPSRPGSRPWSRLAGTSIAEVMMATAIMGLGIATTIIAMQAGFKQLDLARGTTLASQVLQSEMERLRMLSWTGVAALPASETFDGASYFSSNPELANRYTITRTMTADSTRPTEVKNISVSVRWQTYDLRWHRRTFTALYAKNGLYDYYYTVAHP